MELAFYILSNYRHPGTRCWHKTYLVLNKFGDNFHIANRTGQLSHQAYILGGNNMRVRNIATPLIFLGGLASPALAAGDLVPELDFLTWPAAKYQHYYETSNYIAEGWRKLGVRVNLNPAPFPSPMLGMWFKEHKFDVVMSVLSGAPYRMEPDFFTNAQFNSKSRLPGDWNVGGFSDKIIDALGEKQLGIYDAIERRKVILELQAELHRAQPEAIIASVISTHAINTQNVDIPGFEPAPDGLRSIWNLMRMQSKQDFPVRLGQTIDQATFNPLAANTAEDLINLSLVYDRLIELGTDGKPRNRLAKNLKIVDDVTIDVTIRTGHSFSDGKPVTASDVKFSFDYFKKWEASYFKKYLERLESVTIVNDDTLRFKLSQPYAPFILHTLGQIFILPEHVWSSVLEETGLDKPQDFRNDDPIGSGPYTLNYWKEGQELFLSSRTDHYLKPGSDLLYVVFGSAEVVGAALKKGSIDVSLQPLVPTIVKEFAKEPNIKLFRTYSNGYMAARYNVGKPALKDQALRQALAFAIPYAKIIKEVHGGDATRSASSIVPINGFWHNADLELPTFNLKRARKILSDAGYSWDDAGLLHKPE